MKLKLLGSLISLFIFHGCCCSNLSVYDYLLQEPNMNGHVQSSKTITYNFGLIDVGDSLVKSGKKVMGSEVELFDKKGNLIEISYYKADNSLWSKWSYIYNHKGVKTAVDYLYSDRIRTRDTYKYNDKGKLTTIKFYQPLDSLYESTFIRYDHRGNSVEVITKDAISVREKSTFEFLDKRTMKEYSYTDKGTLESSTLYRFDKKRNLIGCESYHPDGSILYRHTKSFDKMGNEVESKMIYRSPPKDPSSDTSSWNIKFNFSGHSKTNYEYDRKGNWIKKVVVSDRDTVFIIEREIEYYRN